jgi:hypothetical protein
MTDHQPLSVFESPIGAGTTAAPSPGCVPARAGGESMSAIVEIKNASSGVAPRRYLSYLGARDRGDVTSGGFHHLQYDGANKHKTSSRITSSSAPTPNWWLRDCGQGGPSVPAHGHPQGGREELVHHPVPQRHVANCSGRSKTKIGHSGGESVALGRPSRQSSQYCRLSTPMLSGARYPIWSICDYCSLRI